MPLAHIGLNTESLPALAAFYLKALAPLGYVKTVEIADGTVLGFGPRFGAPDFWLAGAGAPSARGSSLRLGAEGTVVDTATGARVSAAAAPRPADGAALHLASQKSGAPKRGPKPSTVPSAISTVLT